MMWLRSKGNLHVQHNCNGMYSYCADMYTIYFCHSRHRDQNSINVQRHTVNSYSSDTTKHQIQLSLIVYQFQSVSVQYNYREGCSIVVIVYMYQFQSVSEQYIERV